MNKMEPLKAKRKMEEVVRTILVMIYDDKSQTFGMPKVIQNTQAAIRWFKEALNSQDNIMKNHPSDFSLYHVGYWNPYTGIIEAVEPNLMVEGGKLDKGENNGIQKQ